MITLDAFLGGLLAGAARARTVSDKASVQIADQYLRHDLLKGFPVPRMQVRDLEVVLHFAVSSKLAAASSLQDDEVQRSICYQMTDFLGGLPAHRDFKDYFGTDAQLAGKWTASLEAMTRRFSQVMAKVADSASAIHGLSLSVRNYFYETAPEHRRKDVSSLLARRLRKTGEERSMQGIIEEQIRTIVTSMEQVTPEAGENGALNFNILVGAAELEKLNPAVLNSIKITLNPADRRWVVSEHDGQKVYTLGT